jgi:subtilisin family serine protease
VGAAVAACVLAPTVVLAQEPPPAPEDAWIVTFVPSAPAAQEAVVEEVTGEDAEPIGPRDLVVEATTAEATTLLDRADVVAVERDAEVHVAFVPNDPCYAGPGCPYPGSQVGLRRIGAESAWDVTTGGAVTVAVIDTGVDHDIPELLGRVTQVPLTECPMLTGTEDETSNSHGTSVAGIIAAAGNNLMGISGVVPGTVSVRSYRALGADGSGTTSRLIAAINCAVADGVDVINLSLVAPDQTALANAITAAANAGIVVVAAAGNSSTANHPGAYPAAYPSVIAVAGVTSSDARVPSSNGGSWVDVAAPGSGVVTTARNGAIHAIDGTSFASPFVAGAAALVLSRAPGLTVAQVRARIEGTAEPLPDPVLGRGLVDLASAVRFPVAGSPACSTGPAYLLDGWGGLRPVGGAPLLTGGPYWSGWDIARDVATAPGLPGGYLLDGWGGVNRLGTAPALAPVGPYWYGWDIARAIARRPDGQGVYLLDGWGGVHLIPAVGASPTTSPGGSGSYWYGWDIARDIAVDPTNSTRGFVLDGLGGVHTFGLNASVRVSWYSPTAAIARRLVVLPTGVQGYVLDANGRLHPFAVGSAAMPPPATPATTPASPGRGVDVRNGAVTVATGFGSAVPVGSTPCQPSTTFPGWDIARSYAAAP